MPPAAVVEGTLSAGTLSADAFSACSSVWPLVGGAVTASSDTAPPDAPFSGTASSDTAGSATGESDTPSDWTTMGFGACCAAAGSWLTGAVAAGSGAGGHETDSRRGAAPRARRGGVRRWWQQGELLTGKDQVRVPSDPPPVEIEGPLDLVCDLFRGRARADVLLAYGPQRVARLDHQARRRGFGYGLPNSRGTLLVISSSVLLGLC